MINVYKQYQATKTLLSLTNVNSFILSTKLEEIWGRSIIVFQEFSPG
ncbi:hypothetical protein RINTHH_18120 [Richelia intracellularis HH01]|uniref:Uncharacterized protein n=1 Tax=Richelia intracellularis HH01 TaxID=1165094 RepID=M1WZX1_9NOST|nr:hypothetical protein RINTHH_18120 [Richelia intracellularis HH01]